MPDHELLTWESLENDMERYFLEQEQLYFAQRKSSLEELENEINQLNTTEYEEL